MNYTALTKSYLSLQIERVTRTQQKIAGIDENLLFGLRIPEDGDLPIGTGRRLEAVIMFLDICRFSALESETPAEQSNILRMLTFFFSEMITIIEDYGGIVEKNTGDGLMAYFVRQPNDETPAPTIAVAAALTMFFAAENLINPVLRSSGLTPIEFRICADFGNVTIADVGVARRFRGIVAIGSTANVASKMLQAATPNSLPLGDFMLNGLPQAWKNTFVKLKAEHTGWVYRQGLRPYSFWEYTGRWKMPND